MSNGREESRSADPPRSPGRSRERVRQERAMRRAMQSEGWLEQLERIAEQARGKPRPKD